MDAENDGRWYHTTAIVEKVVNLDSLPPKAIHYIISGANFWKTNTFPVALQSLYCD